MNSPISLQEVDCKMIDYYKDFLPKKIFDVHMHMKLSAILDQYDGSDGRFEEKTPTPTDYGMNMSMFFPDVQEIRLNMMPSLEVNKRDQANAHVLELFCLNHRNVVSPYILPNDDEKKIDELTNRSGVYGLKCYAYGSRVQDIEKVSIGDFLPESAWVIANTKHLPIFLHIMRPAALSDPDNFAYISKMAKRYPNAKLVLSHCARGFASWTAVGKIRELEDTGNIWFDVSAICEPSPMMACIIKNGGKRTMWGTDYPSCLYRGRAISLAKGQTWLIGASFEGLERSYIVCESLMALYQTALLLNLDNTQIEDLFYNNALRLFDIA